MPRESVKSPLEAEFLRTRDDDRARGALDGWQAHGTRSAFREDRARDRALKVAGYSVIHLTWNQLDDEPEAIAADLRSVLEMDR